MYMYRFVMKMTIICGMCGQYSAQWKENWNIASELSCHERQFAFKLPNSNLIAAIALFSSVAMAFVWMSVPYSLMEVLEPPYTYMYLYSAYIQRIFFELALRFWLKCHTLFRFTAQDKSLLLCMSG